MNSWDKQIKYIYIFFFCYANVSDLNNIDCKIYTYDHSNTKYNAVINEIHSVIECSAQLWFFKCPQF